MLRTLNWVGVVAAALVLAACGGGDPSPAEAGARLAAAPMAVVDMAKCGQAGSGAHLEGGQCIARFDGVRPTVPAPAARQQNPQKQGAQKQAAQQPLAIPDMAALFNWAPSAYPAVFNGGSFDGSIYMPGFGTFNYRYYNTGNYLAVLGSGVYVYGWATGYTIYYVGTLSDFSCSVYSCGVGGGGSTGANVTIGSTVGGAFYTSGGYVDHSVYLYAGSSYAFTMTSGAFDTYLELYDPYGAYVTYDDDSAGNLNSRIAVVATYTGYYTLRASSYTSGYGSYTLSGAYASGGGGGGGGGGSYISWTNSDNGVVVVDANNEHFAFNASSRCLYSYNTQSTTTNFCLYSGSANGNFAGQAVTVMLVAASGGGCIAALADPYGYQIDIYTSNGVQTVTTTNSMYNTTGCTY